MTRSLLPLPSTAARKNIPAALIALLLLAVSSVACGPSPAELGARASQTAQSSALTQTAQAPTVTPTPTPTSTLTPTPTATPTPGALVLAELLNVREGPGLEFPEMGSLALNEELDVVGQFGGCAWLQVQSRAHDLGGWIAGDGQFVELRAACETLPPGTFRPLSGLVQPNQGATGLGEFTIDNGTAQDGVVIMTLAEQPVVAAYVRSGESYTLTGISDGVYYLYFSTGADWNGQKFTTNASHQRFEDAFEFTTSATTYSIWSITLHGVEGGNASAESVGEDDFPQIGE